MAIAILSYHNNRFDHKKNLAHRNPNSRLCRHSYLATMAPRRHKRSPKAASKSSSNMVESPTGAKSDLVMEKVKILKRGETLSSFQNKENSNCDNTTRRPLLKTNEADLIVSSTSRLGPDPVLVMKQIVALKGMEIFAGSGCSVSPPPCFVPVPCFLGNNY